jgi:hypothetical protein
VEITISQNQVVAEILVLDQVDHLGNPAAAGTQQEDHQAAHQIQEADLQIQAEGHLGAAHLYHRNLVGVLLRGILQVESQILLLVVVGHQYLLQGLLSLLADLVQPVSKYLLLLVMLMARLQVRIVLNVLRGPRVVALQRCMRQYLFLVK